MVDHEQLVLKANESFYEAMVTGDYRSMESLWAKDNDVVVVHPGWPPLHGWDAVMDSWRRILRGDSTRGIYCSNARPYVMDKVALVVCSECFPEGELVATNIFIFEDGKWKIMHHQGGPMHSIVEDSLPESIH